MARIPMTSGFQIMPEGVYIFRIYDVTYDEDFGKAVIKMVTADGQTYSERFSLKDKNDQWNDKALNAFSYFCKTALNDFKKSDIDPSELIGHYIEAEVTHTVLPSNKDPNKTVTFANLGDKKVATQYDEEPCEKVKGMFPDLNIASAPKAEEKKESNDTGLDLKALLGDDLDYSDLPF